MSIKKYRCASNSAKHTWQYTNSLAPARQQFSRADHSSQAVKWCIYQVLPNIPGIFGPSRPSPTPSSCGHKYLMIFYDHVSNYICIWPIKIKQASKPNEKPKKSLSLSQKRISTRVLDFGFWTTNFLKLLNLLSKNLASHANWSPQVCTTKTQQGMPFKNSRPTSK